MVRSVMCAPSDAGEDVLLVPLGFVRLEPILTAVRKPRKSGSDLIT
jgi:hypothetical protein